MSRVVVTGIRGGGIVFANPELTVTFEDDTSVFVKFVDKKSLLDSLEKLSNLELAKGLFLTIGARSVVAVSHDDHIVHLGREELLNNLYRG